MSSTSQPRRSLRRDLADPMSTVSSTTSITPSESVSAAHTNDSDNTATNQTSWVWQYFAQIKDKDGILKNMCRANKGFIDQANNDPDAVVVVCDEATAVDKTSSTKTMIRHLQRAHHIETPIETSQGTLTGWGAGGKIANVSFFHSSFIFLYFIFFL
jgi:hypothetical protein